MWRKLFPLLFLLSCSDDPASSPPLSDKPRSIEWSGYKWSVRSNVAKPSNPGPNYFCNSEEFVSVQDDKLHLSTGRHPERDAWCSVEVDLEQALGYGEYTFCFASPVDNIDPRTVVAAFLYKNNEEELDIEFSKSLSSKGALYAAQPGRIPGNSHEFAMADDAEHCHRISWTKDEVVFKSWSGLADKPSPETLIAEWSYKGPNIPVFSAELPIAIINVWFYSGQSPSKRDEVILDRFIFKPLT